VNYKTKHVDENECIPRWVLKQKKQPNILGQTMVHILIGKGEFNSINKKQIN